MNAAETIAAAIEKLEGLRPDSTPGPWAATPYGVETVPEFDLHRFDSMAETIFRTELHDADSYLVVTLHRTIDAQLAMLRMEHPIANALGDRYGNTEGSTDRAFLDLARAILGVAS